MPGPGGRMMLQSQEVKQSHENKMNAFMFARARFPYFPPIHALKIQVTYFKALWQCCHHILHLSTQFTEIILQKHLTQTLTNLSFSGSCFHTSASFLLSSPKSGRNKKRKGKQKRKGKKEKGKRKGKKEDKCLKQIES